jgi:hypothetical protein
VKLSEVHPEDTPLLVVEKNGEADVVYAAMPHQLHFHQSETLNYLMEGGAGSGKSKAMRFDAYARCWQVPRFRALILRRSMPELRMSHLDEVPFDAERMGLDKTAWHSTNFTLRFPNGSIVVFAHVEDDATIARFLSSEWDIIYFDELTTFTLRQFLFLSSRARTTKPGLRALVRGGTNPVGPGATWVKRFFLDKTVTEKEAPGYNPSEWEARKSTVRDNRYVNLKDYQRKLQMLPSEALRRAMEFGEWVIEGQFFSEFLEETRDGKPWHVIEKMPQWHGRPIQFAPHIEIVRVIDWGYAVDGNPGRCEWWACLTDGSAICFDEYMFTQTLPEDVCREIERKSEGLKIRYTVGDPQMFTEHEGPSIAEHFAVHGISCIEGDNARVPGWLTMHTWLRETVNTGLVEYPRLRWLKDTCPVAIRTIPVMVVDPKHPEDMVTTGVEDEASDTARYFVTSRPGSSREKTARNPNTAWIFDEIRKMKNKGWRVGSEATRR